LEVVFHIPVVRRLVPKQDEVDRFLRGVASQSCRHVALELLKFRDELFASVKRKIRTQLESSRLPLVSPILSACGTADKGHDKQQAEVRKSADHESHDARTDVRGWFARRHTWSPQARERNMPSFDKRGDFSGRCGWVKAEVFHPHGRGRMSTSN
jgi:hypothetical protein